MAGMTRHLAYQKQWYVTGVLHVLPGLGSQRGDLRRIDFRDQFTDAACDLHPVLVELILPEHAGKYRTSKSLLRRNRLRGAALVRPHRRTMT